MWQAILKARGLIDPKKLKQAMDLDKKPQFADLGKKIPKEGRYSDDGEYADVTDNRILDVEFEKKAIRVKGDITVDGKTHEKQNITTTFENQGDFKISAQGFKGKDSGPMQQETVTVISSKESTKGSSGGKDEGGSLEDQVFLTKVSSITGKPYEIVEESGKTTLIVDKDTKEIKQLFEDLVKELGD